MYGYVLSSFNNTLNLGLFFFIKLHSNINASASLTTALCNIYDMGGNVGEFTTELNPGTSETVVLRGGGDSDLSPAGYRWDSNSGGAYSDCGFRATLFLK